MMILTTGPTVEGRPVTRYLDVVTAQGIMGVHIGRDVEALGRSIIGGRSDSYEEEFERAVHEAKEELQAAAEALEADAVIAVGLAARTSAPRALRRSKKEGRHGCAPGIEAP